MSHKSLEDLLGSVESPVGMLRNASAGPNVYPGVPAEFTNWRDEQVAWQKTCVLYNQSFHMADLAVEGPDARRLLSHLAVNSFDGFEVGKAKHFVPCTPAGHVIGDVILFALGDDRFNLVGRAPALNWVTFHAETGDYDVRVELDQRTTLRTDGRRKSYRFQVQGPNAMQVVEKALGAKPPELKFFNMTTVTIGGREVHALRHGMAGQPGWELFGPWDDYEPVHEALVSAGEDFGMRLVGGRAYSSNTLESGWIPSPLPAVYSGDELKPYRQWLPATGYEGSGLDRRQLRLGRDRRLLLHAVGSRLRKLRQVRSRLHRAGSARGARRWRPPPEGHAGARRRGRDPHDRVDVPASRPREVHGLAVCGVLDAPVRPRHGRR